MRPYILQDIYTNPILLNRMLFNFSIVRSTDSNCEIYLFESFGLSGRCSEEPSLSIPVSCTVRPTIDHLLSLHSNQFWNYFAPIHPCNRPYLEIECHCEHQTGYIEYASPGLHTVSNSGFFLLKYLLTRITVPIVLYYLSISAGKAMG